MVRMKDLSPAQQRLITDMVGSRLRRTSKGWFAKSNRPHAEVTRLKVMSLGLMQSIPNGLAYELTNDAHELAIGLRESAGHA